MTLADYPLLRSVDGPATLRAMDPKQLESLADELRAYLIETISRTGGHLSAGLGVVELTIALHALYDTPEDRIVWDVGHQCYPHKILTGRAGALESVRKRRGIAGFPQREESVFDAFGTGHASTSISAALGMAAAIHARRERRRVVAVIGDGALTGGQAFEALNNAGAGRNDLLVILNDNDMSISPNVGALARYLGRVLSGRFYTRVRERSKAVLQGFPQMKEFARRWEEHTKGMVMPSTMFEEMGFNYHGPVDGHDLPALLRILRNIRDLQGPRLLHVVTTKGKGYAPAEGDPCNYHGVGPFDPKTGKMETRPSSVTYTQVFSDWLCDLGAADPRLVAITPAMREGSGLVAFSERFPDRYFDVGIAEAHALTFAAGLACEGMKPVVAIYSTFLQRAYDQLIHDICLQNLPVLFAIDRGGLVGADGPTHHGAFDLSFLRSVPNLTVMAPADEAELRAMLLTGFKLDGPAAVRYPRGAGPGVVIPRVPESIAIGRAEIRRRGKTVAILAVGSMVGPAESAGAALGASVVNLRFVKPLDRDTVVDVARTHALVVTVEENVVAGGAGSAVLECLAEAGVETPVLTLGLPDCFIPHGNHGDLLSELGLDAPGLERRIRHALAGISLPSNLTI